MSSALHAKALKSPHALWVLGDPDSILPGLKKVLGRRYSVRSFKDSAELQRAAQAACSGSDADAPALLLADVDSRNGDLLRYLKGRETQEGAHPPFVVITSCNDPTVIRACLSQGALDYLIQPIDPNLFVVKIQWWTERGDAPICRGVEGLRVNPVSLVVSCPRGRRTRVTVKELQILAILREAFPEGVGRDTFRREIWPGVNVVTKTLDTHLFNLRRKIEPLGYEIRFKTDGTYVLAPLGEQ